MNTRQRAPAWGLALALALVLVLAAAAASAATGGEATLRLDDRRPGAGGPLAAAEERAPGLAGAQPSGMSAELELRHDQPLGAGYTLHANLRLAHERLDGRGGHDDSRVNEMHLAWNGGAWQAGIGRQVVSWDVGYGFRPNDVVQQEERRSLLPRTLQGRPLLRLEHFDADTAWTLVAVRPEAWRRAADAPSGGDEPAMALRVYRRVGALDLHGFAREGRRSGPSVGAALAWVVDDALELHASWRGLRRTEGWALDPSAATPAAQAPWQRRWGAGGTQWLLGAQWTGGPAVSVLAEWWHDGQAPSDDAWRRWGARTQALLALTGPAAAGNLAWQALPLAGPGLRRDNGYLRVSWQPGDWTLATDVLLHPADRGHALGASVQWRGPQWRVDLAWRGWYGPQASLAAQLPLRRQAALALSRAF